MDEEEFYKNLEETFSSIPESFNILEEQIDIKVQANYFEFSKKIRDEHEPEDFFARKEKLFEKIGSEQKKEILVGLASIPDVEVFRTLEKYMKKPDKELKEWAVLALQENRMLLQSSLLDEQQVFISTGMGGKGTNLRYFVVFFNHDLQTELADFQKKILEDELNDIIETNSGEMEEVLFRIGYNSATILLPLKAALRDIFDKIVSEVNQYGEFLSDDVIITNIKKLGEKEIYKLIEERRNDNSEELGNETN